MDARSVEEVGCEVMAGLDRGQRPGEIELGRRTEGRCGSIVIWVLIPGADLQV